MNLAEIDNWIDSAPDTNGFRNNNDFMQFMVEAMNRSSYLLRVGAALAPDEASSGKGFTKRRAIIAGHMVRVVKLYEGLLIHTAKRQLELASIFNRLIFETAIRAEYLMQSKNKSFRQYVLSSYKPEKEMLTDLGEKASMRPLTQIEKRMRRKMKEKLKKDGVSLKALMANRQWNLDGKDFRRIMEDAGYGSPIYAYGFGCSSHQIHGDWFDISATHLKKKGRYYTPDLTWGDPDPRLAAPLTIVCLKVLLKYLKWSKTDPDKVVSPTVLKMLDLVRALDDAHEATLGS
jgi:hypothetical protein